ncbi:hypothetical protein PHJA_002818300 [Phtheirospermum japonicum]|uniref:Uncharacterized protein n=1 Tax=Phtheirospermum japonicum TaxID=374723 RepID=A0A830D7W7_9LAMI|nr:hypothetical protein PHJA_002818300 [Phtheirospermum japonicum]
MAGWPSTNYTTSFSASSSPSFFPFSRPKSVTLSSAAAAFGSDPSSPSPPAPPRSSPTSWAFSNLPARPSRTPSLISSASSSLLWCFTSIIIIGAHPHLGPDPTVRVIPGCSTWFELL